MVLLSIVNQKKIIMAGIQTVTYKIKNADIKAGDAAATSGAKIDLITVIGAEPTTIYGFSTAKLDDVYSEITVCYKV